MQMEKSLLYIVGYENLITSSIYEFIKTYFYDFRKNNESLLTFLNIHNLIDDYEKASMYFAKLTLHYDRFYRYG
jgi:hypothetical protein